MPTRILTASTSEEKRVILVATTSRDSVAIKKVLGEASIDCCPCQDLVELCHQIGDGAAAIIISEEALVINHTYLGVELSKQDVWSDLPVIVLSKSGIELPVLTTALPHLGNVSVLERPVRMNTLLSVIRSALRARERQYQVREHLAQKEKDQKQLRSSEERLRLAVNTGKLGIWELDLAVMEMRCSNTCKANFGRRPSDNFRYSDFIGSVHKSDVDRVMISLQEAISNKTELEIEFKIVWPDRSEHWLLMRGRPFYDAEEAPSLMNGVTLDITDRKTMELHRATILEAERCARTEAERIGRIKDEFLATLSHELRTPLNAILGWAQILRRKPKEIENFCVGIDIIERNARAQAQIIEDLLDMSRIISGKINLNMESVDLVMLLQAAVNSVQPAADAKGVELELSVNFSRKSISGDTSRLQQIFWNLLHNAVKFTPKGGKVTAAVRAIDSSIEVTITDTGSGIDSSFLPHVFDRFRQADSTTTRAHGGLGIGLAIVKQLVELHGGTVAASSGGKDKGAIFTVLLPIRPLVMDLKYNVKYEVVSTKSSKENNFVSLGGLKVLVVDDEADSRNLIKRLLEECSASVITASSAEEGFHLLKQERPNVVVSDVGMPGEDGYAFVRRIRKLESEIGGHTPAIALTAYARAEDKAFALDAGFQHHLVKPVEATELIALLASFSGLGAV